MTRPLTRKEVADLCECRADDIPQSPAFSLTQFVPPGPVCAAYIRSKGPVDGIMGPGGSGKTVGSFFKFVRAAVADMPVCTDGVVRARVTTLRDNYRSLYRTTLRSWFNFFPPNFPQSTFFGGADRPAQHYLRLSTVRMVDGVRREVPVDLTVDFFAVGDASIEELLKSYETSFGYANEGDQLHIRVIPFLYSRTGRYPSREMLPEGAVRPRFVCFDMNPPKPNHPLLKAARRGTFKDADPNGGWQPAGEQKAAEIGAEMAAERAINFFEQPSGLSPEAENRAGKTYEEYLEDMKVMPEEEARRMVQGLPGFATDGKPVYVREWSRKKHVAAGALQVLQGVPLDIGFDQGLSPSAVLGQVSSFGQVRILATLYLGHNVGYERFLAALVPLLTSPRFRNLPPGVYTGDPAGFMGGDKIGGELTWMDTISRALGHQIYAASTNEPGLRWEAVRQRLTHDIDAQTPGLIIDPSDPGNEMLIEGFEAEYKFPKYKETAQRAYGDQVADNEFTNPHDALQYLILGRFGRAGIINEAAKAGRPGNVVPMPTGRRGGDSFNVWNV